MRAVCWRTAISASSRRRAWSSGGAGVDMVVLYLGDGGNAIGERKNNACKCCESPSMRSCYSAARNPWNHYVSRMTTPAEALATRRTGCWSWSSAISGGQQPTAGLISCFSGPACCCSCSLLLQGGSFTSEYPILRNISSRPQLHVINTCAVPYIRTIHTISQTFLLFIPLKIDQ